MATLPFIEPVRVYDTPQILAAQLLEGEAGLSAFKDLFLSPENLSPAERSSLSAAFFDKDDKLSRTFMEVVTNPFVLLSFLVSPVGAKALSAGKSVFTPLAKYASQNKSGLSFLSLFNTPTQELRGSNLDRVMQWVPDQIIRQNEVIRKTTLKGQAAAKRAIEARMTGLHKRGFKWIGDENDLDVTRYLQGSPERQVLEEFQDYAAGVASGDYRPLYKRRIPEVVLENTVVKYGPKYPDSGKRGTELPFVVDPSLLKNQRGIASSIAEAQVAIDEAKEAARTSFFSGQVKNAGISKQYWDAAKAKGDPTGQAAFDLYWEDFGYALGGTTVRVPVGGRTEKGVFAETLYDDFVRMYGQDGLDYVNKYSNAKKEAFVFALGKDDLFQQTTKRDAEGAVEVLGDFEFDEGKLDGLVGALRRKQVSESGSGKSQFADLLNGNTNFEGMDALMAALGAENLLTIAKMQTPAQSKKALQQLVKVIVGVDVKEKWRDTYFTRTAMNVGRIDGKTPHTLGDFDSTIVNEAPYAAAKVLPNTVAPLSQTQALWDHEYLQRMAGRGLLTKDGERLAQEALETTVRNAKEGRATMLVSPDMEKGHGRYVTRMVTTGVFETQAAPRHLIEGNDEAIKMLADKTQGSAPITSYLSAVDGKEVKVRGNTFIGDVPNARFSISDLTDMALVREKDNVRREWFKVNVLPNVLHTMGPKALNHYNQTLRQRQIAKWFAESPVAPLIEKAGPAGADFVKAVRQFGDADAKYNVRDPRQGIASYLYGTHLGLNMSSIILNLTQPLIGAALHGNWDDVAVAYGRGAKETATYIQKRLALGINPTLEAKEAAMKASFKHMGMATGGRNVLGIAASPEAIIDGYVQQQRKGGPFSRINDALLWGFSTSEMMNRSVAAHLFERINSKAGQLGRGGYVDDLEEFVRTYQFGTGPLNTPRLFDSPILDSPLSKMFLSFPVRMVGSTFLQTPLMGGESRTAGLGRTVARGLGYSALVYEVAKGLGGVDISRGLFAESALGPFNPMRLSDPSESAIPLPPILDMPIDALRALTSEDKQLMSTVVARALPGGVALAKAIGLGPEAPRIHALGNLPGALQTTFVGWGEPLPTGEVPVFRGDGTLLEYRRPSEIVARGLGLDLGKWGQAGELDNYLNKQREQIIGMRQEYVRALASNNMGQAKQVEAAFQKRFKVPLTVSEAQVTRFLRNQEVGRTERALDRIDPTVRDVYAGVADQAGAGRNVAGGFSSGPTASNRQRVNPTRSNDEALIQEIMRRQSVVGPAASNPSSAFAPY